MWWPATTSTLCGQSHLTRYVDQIQLLAVAAFVRAAEGAERAGAPGHAAALFGSAAELHEQDGQRRCRGPSWEQAAEAWIAEQANTQRSKCRRTCAGTPRRTR